MKKYFLEIIVFIGGAVVMILELTATRVLAPYVGSSIIVWTSLIGIILGSLSLGYWQGGKIADKKPSWRVLAFIILLASLSIGLVAMAKDLCLALVQDNISDIRIRSIISTLILFAPTSVLLGMVLPFAIRLKMTSIKKSGETSGALFAFSTVGSIVGTFIAGFFLIAFLGSSKILVLLSVLLLATSFMAFAKDEKNKGKVLALFLIFALLVLVLIRWPIKPLAFVDKDTLYSRVLLEKVTWEERPVLTMRTGILGVQSAVFLDKDDELVSEYTKYYRLVEHFRPEVKQALALGGGGYSYPKDFLKKFPKAKLDVVEIDPEITELARTYFNLKDDSRLTIYHQDGRGFLNTNKVLYDAIFVDVYGGDMGVPFQLTTVEAVTAMHETLNDGGVTIINIIGSIEGDTGKFFRAELTTYKSIFPQVYLFPTKGGDDRYRVQNIMLVALKSSKKAKLASGNEELNAYLKNLWTKEVSEDMPTLTDDYAPVDQYTKDIILERK